MKELIIKIFEFMDDVSIKYFDDAMPKHVKFGLWTVVGIIFAILSWVGCDLAPDHPNEGHITFLQFLTMAVFFLSCIGIIICGVMSACELYISALKEFKERKRTRDRMMEEC